MSDISTFGFDKSPVVHFERFRGICEGEKRYISIINTADGKPSVMGVKAHYYSPLGYFACKNGLCCHKLGKPRWRYGTVILEYEIN